MAMEAYLLESVDLGTAGGDAGRVVDDVGRVELGSLRVELLLLEPLETTSSSA